MTTIPHQPGIRARISATTLLRVAMTVGVLVAVGLLIGAPEPPFVPPGGRALRRIPAPPPDLPSLLRFLGVGSVTWYACAAAVGPAWWFARRFPIAPVRPWRAVSAQFALLAALVFATTLAQYWTAYGGSRMAPGFVGFIPVALTASALPILAVFAIVNALEVRRRAISDVLEAERLRAQLAETRLAAVTMQLQPHFLFNTLQGISTLIHRDPAAADAMLAKLSDLLRDVLRRSQSALVSFDDEMRMTETYLDLARLRYAERLRVELAVDDAARAAVVPMLLLQPLIENALKHGVGPRAAGGTVGVTARAIGGRLTITVWDDGVGIATDGRIVEGTGLTNIRERLRQAFGDDQSLVLSARAGGGTQVAIAIPLRTAGAGTA
jgi:two-component system LytT family sensor kinase